MLTHKEIYCHEDPRWEEPADALRAFLAAAPATMNEILAWGAGQGWHEHFSRNALVWLESRGLVTWSGAARKWTGRDLTGYRRAAPASPAPPTPARRRPAPHHRTCQSCERSYYASDPRSRFCPTCRPEDRCALCGDRVPADPAWLGTRVFCSPRHRARFTGPSPSRKHRHVCSECGVAFWGVHGPGGGDHYCCTRHRMRAQVRRAEGKPTATLSSTLLLVIRHALPYGKHGALSRIATAFGVHRNTLWRRLSV